MKVSAHKTHSASHSNHSPSKAHGGGKKNAGGGDVFDRATKNASKDQSEGDLIKQQKELQDYSRQMELKATIIKLEHDLKSKIISMIAN